MSSRHVSEAEEEQGPSPQEIIEEFYDSELAGVGYLEQGRSRPRYPRITAKIQDQAISKNYLMYDERDKIIKDPNKLSIFFLQMRPDSPFTASALQSLNLTEDDCKTLLFEEFYDQKSDPILSLIKYMNYMRERYKLLQQILNRRNLIKKTEKQNANKKKASTSSVVSPNAEGSTFLTQQQALQTSQLQQSRSFHLTDMNERMQMTKHRNSIYRSTYLRHMSYVQQHMKELDNYYEQRKPFFEAKVQKVLDQNQKKVEEHIKQRNERMAKTLKKIESMQEHDLELRKRFNDELMEKEMQNEQNRKKLDDHKMKQMKEREQMNDQMAQKREERRLLAQQLEQEEIDQIVQESLRKDTISKRHLEKLRDMAEQRKQTHEKISIETQKKVHEFLLDQEKKVFNSFVKAQSLVQEKISIQEKQRQQTVEERQKKVIEKHKIILKNKEKQTLELQKKLAQIQEREQEDEEKIKKHQQILEQRQLSIIRKNKLKLDKVLSNTSINQTLENSSKILEKLSADQQRVKTLRQQQEELKKLGFQEHVALKKQIEEFYRSMK